MIPEFLQPYWPQISDISAWVIPLLIAITLHEAAHGWMAYRFGDETAYRRGRVSFNPFRHIDRFGTIVLPGLLILAQSPFLFGYAKPVPVRFENLAPARLGMFMVAVAGVTLNLVLAMVSALALHIEQFGITPEQAPWLYMNLYRSLMINIVLAVFNMIPLLPFDGGRAVYAWLPHGLQRIFAKTEKWGLPVVFLFLLVPALMDHYLNTDFALTERLIGMPVATIAGWILTLTGNGTALDV